VIINGKKNAARITDPLNELTRKERRLLLIINLIGFFIGWTNAIPTKIAALGIEFDKVDQKSFLWIFAIAIIYLTIVFAIYATADYIKWINAISDEAMGNYRNDLDNAVTSGGNPIQEHMEQFEYSEFYKNRFWYRLTRPNYFGRIIFEFLVPIIFSCATIGVLIFSAYKI